MKKNNNHPMMIEATIANWIDEIGTNVSDDQLDTWEALSEKFAWDNIKYGPQSLKDYLVDVSVPMDWPDDEEQILCTALTYTRAYIGYHLQWAVDHEHAVISEDMDYDEYYDVLIGAFDHMVTKQAQYNNDNNYYPVLTHENNKPNGEHVYLAAQYVEDVTTPTLIATTTVWNQD